jgi:hypothetical protein
MSATVLSSTRWARLFALVANSLLLICLAGPAPVLADAVAGGERQARQVPAIRLPRPYCGLAACYAAMRLAGKTDIEFQALFRPEYLTSPEGSTVDEIRRAVGDNGLTLSVVDKMDIAALRRTVSPLILHTRSIVSLPHYDHWLLYLGEKEGKALIYDIPHAPKLMSFAEVSRAWDGVALEPVSEL